MPRSGAGRHEAQPLRPVSIVFFSPFITLVSPSIGHVQLRQSLFAARSIEERETQDQGQETHAIAAVRGKPEGKKPPVTDGSVFRFLTCVFIASLQFTASLSDLENRTLWLTVWHSDMFGRNDFLGEVLLPLAGRIFDDPTPHWYPLQERVLDSTT